MVGKGSTRHNSRKFMADNIVKERTPQNVEYCNERIEDVYHQLFDEALERFNAKQKRNDRKIDDYYEKIRSGKQEKTFHEIILQVGNHYDMASGTEEGELAKKILDEYYRGFAERNRTLRVFSAHIHMDEATPHIHIDFVPYTTGSARGLDTRVSLKKALFELGFEGGSKQDTEWNQWVESEKHELSLVMERFGVTRIDKNEPHEHLSVLNYKREERAKEVAELNAQIEELSLTRELLTAEIEEKKDAVEDANEELSEITGEKEEISTEISEYYNLPEWQLPEPKAFTGLKKYIADVVEPLIDKLKNVIKDLIGKVHEYAHRTEIAEQNSTYYRKRADVLSSENRKLKEDSELLDTIWGELGDEKINEILVQAERRQYGEYEEDYESDGDSRPKKKDYDLSL